MGQSQAKLGVKMNVWEKVGLTKDVGVRSEILFRGSDDSGSLVGGEPVRVSDNWYVWRIGDPEFTYVGKLEGANRAAELGTVVNPYDVIERMKTGEYSFVYPSFE